MHLPEPDRAKNEGGRIMANPVVTFSKSDSLGYITLDRPPANSYEIGFVSDLDAARQAAQDETVVKVVILRSASDRLGEA